MNHFSVTIIARNNERIRYSAIAHTRAQAISDALSALHGIPKLLMVTQCA